VIYCGESLQDSSPTPFPRISRAPRGFTVGEGPLAAASPQTPWLVYDGVGNATFPDSLDCLRPFGYFVSFGSASGQIPPFDIMLLAEKGSLFATWPVLTMHLAKREDVLSMSQDLFNVVASSDKHTDKSFSLA
jgi:NADPH:quinone reductase-like Zn-dependent oxidoreductase